MWWAYLLILGNTIFNVSGNVFFKLSADSNFVGDFALWQVVGNTLTTIGVISYSLSMKKLPLHIAYPLAQALQVIGVTIVVGLVIFNESISLINWFGVALIASGVVIFSLKPKEDEETEKIEPHTTEVSTQIGEQ